MTAKGAYLFGNFRFDQERGLYRGGVEISLPPRVRALLLLLLSAGGAPVEREALIATCTDDAADVDGAVSRAVYLLRKALGDKDQQIVKTDYGRGLRLGIPVVQDQPAGKRDLGSTARLPDAFAQAATGEEMIRTAFELASSRTDQSLRLAGKVLGNALQRFPSLALAPSLHADMEVSRMIRGYVRPAAHAKQTFALADKALGITPGLPSALATKGWLTGVILDDRAAGLRMIDDAILNSPAMWIARFYKSWLLVGERQLEAAADTLDQALLISPLERALLSMKGLLLCSMGKIDEAAHFVDEALVLRPDVDLLWIAQTIIRVQRGEIEAAQRSIGEAITIAPRDTQVQAYKAWTDAVTGNARGAQQYLSRRAKSPSTYVLPVKLAMVRNAMSDETGAKNLLHMAVSDKDPWRLLAWCDPCLKA